MVTVISAVLVFGFLIFIHEFGHFITARLFKVTVNEFAIGMGPKLVSWQSKKSGTKYSVRALPIGGYVSMVGEDGENALGEGDSFTGDPNGFDRKPAWQRFIITVAGAFVNLLFGFLAMFLLTAMIRIGGTTIHRFMPSEDTGFDISTEDSGLKVGDEIIAINGKRVSIIDELYYEVNRHGIEPVDVTVIRDELKSIGGDSIVTYSDGDIVKVHVHTLTPGVALNVCQKYGEFLHLKIENMTLQHNETKKSAPKKKVAVVAVANGKGLIDLFTDLGADAIVDGGQTSNPAAIDFLNAFEEVNAENIIVLTNNSNGILSATQASRMFEGSNVYVIPTKSMQQGYVALSLLNTSVDDIEEHIGEIEEMLSDVTSIDVTYAVRTASINGKTVHKGWFMAISNGDLLASGEGKIEVAVKSIQNVPDIEDKEIITVFIGADVTDEEKEILEDELMASFPDQEITLLDGGQEVYSFLITIE